MITITDQEHERIRSTLIAFSDFFDGDHSEKSLGLKTEALVAWDILRKAKARTESYSEAENVVQ